MKIKNMLGRSAFKKVSRELMESNCPQDTTGVVLAVQEGDVEVGINFMVVILIDHYSAKYDDVVQVTETFRWVAANLMNIANALYEQNVGVQVNSEHLHEALRLIDENPCLETGRKLLNITYANSSMRR
jgi:hypothetical protein